MRQNIKGTAYEDQVDTITPSPRGVQTGRADGTPYWLGNTEGGIGQIGDRTR